MKSTKPKTNKQELPVMRIQFEVLTVLQPEVVTKNLKVRANKKLRKGLADYLRFEAHKFIDSRTVDDIIDHATIEIEEVELEDENQS